MDRTLYDSPLNTRYASKAMSGLFSMDTRITTWRKLWVALAEAEMELGLPVTKEQVDELQAHIEPVNYDVAEKKEGEIRHDVMAHVFAYGEQCPKARGIIHLGATSCYVTDNADIIIYAQALDLVKTKLLAVIKRLTKFALEYKAVPQLGYTHLQPAQLVTVGKRACLWIQDLLLDVNDVTHVRKSMKLLGNKGTTGTQASFMELFDNDEGKVIELEKRIVAKMGFASAYAVTGQTYPRKLDSSVVNALSGIAQSAHKFATDLRLLQHLREVEEPFEKGQVGSSAMAYKRNPMRSERICSLARHVIALQADPAMTAATQWLERTLDDSANRRIAIPEAFLCVDAILEIMANVAGGLVVYPKMIARNIEENLPFMATENIMMEAVKRGGDRQALHERIRIHSQAAASRMKADGLDCDLLRRIAGDAAFGLSQEDLADVLDPNKYTGRSAGQVIEFIEKEVMPLLADDGDLSIGDLRV
jgi:adenylosuccinate lyase